MKLKDIISNYANHAEESLEYQRHDDFNQRLDDGELDGFDLLLKLPSGDEHPIAPMSATIFANDLPKYRSLVREDLEYKRAVALSLDDFPRNEQAYDRFLQLMRRNATVIPFVGAGFSVAAGCPSWSAYILSQAVRARMDEDEVSSRLENGEHESVMDEVIEELSVNVFQRDFADEFEGGRIDPLLSPSAVLMELLDSCFITTNFDRVLENSNPDKLFAEKVVGNDTTGRFVKAVYRSEKYLLKLHGNIDDQRDRVLTREEYNQSYGEREGDIDYSLPIPRTLKRVFSNCTVVFVGCSLIADRYMRVLKESHDESPEFFPDHFAILVAPNDEDELTRRDRFLADHGITPIWFSAGDWEKPAEILELLRVERGNKA